MNGLCTVPTTVTVHNSSFTYIQLRTLPPAVLVNVRN